MWGCWLLLLLRADSFFVLLIPDVVVVVVPVIDPVDADSDEATLFWAVTSSSARHNLCINGL